MMDLVLFYFEFLFLYLNIDEEDKIWGERDGIVEELPSMYIMPISNLLEVMGSIP